jgi:septal ring factor EnvC (AmiA/AmiB activator)
LLKKLTAAKTGEGDPAEVARLEGELETVKGQLKDTTKKLTTTEKTLATANDGLTAEQCSHEETCLSIMA